MKAMSDRKILFTPKKSIIARGNENRRLTFYAIIDIGGFQMSEHDEDEDESDAADGDEEEREATR